MLTENLRAVLIPLALLCAPASASAGFPAPGKRLGIILHRVPV
jgi:hypothetical protein